MLTVSETFASLQGEGPHTGRPAFFIRLTGCVAPLCPWCDTKQAWKGGEKMGVDALIDAVGEHTFVVITGGEPFAQWDHGLSDLDARLFDKGVSVQYETSGKAGIPDGVKGEIVCSPKYLDGAWHLDPSILSKVHHYKFVVSKENLSEIDAFIDTKSLEKDRVWLMPMGMTRDEQIERLPLVWEHCMEKGYRLASRLHILAFDMKKGI